MAEITRCTWATTDADLQKYHDEEWGVPLHDEHKLFEAIVLDGAQAGLSWSTILKRREGYRRAFKNFDPAIVAKFNETKMQKLLTDTSTIRNKAKIRSAVMNARATLALYDSGTTLDELLWSFVDGKPKQNNRRTHKNLPAVTPASTALSKELQRRGFTFVGPTIIYALMQAAGLVNDHLIACFRYAEVQI